MRAPLSALPALAALALLPAVAAAQAHPDVVRGRVTGQDGTQVRGAVVAVTRAPDRLTLTTHTDSAGAFSLRFGEGTGDYLVHVSALGWKDFRQRVTRTAPRDSVLRVDAKLATAAIALAPVAVSAQRPRPPRGREMEGGPGATERTAGDGVYGLLPPDQAGDLDRLATTVPGVTLGPSGLSVLGTAGQTAYTLNGMSFDGGSVPRGMRTSTRVSLGTYDPARGGFGGAEVATELQPGSRFTRRSASATVDAHQAQAYDRAARQLGHEWSGVQVDASGDGELVADRWFYNVGVRGQARQSAAPSLFTLDRALLGLAGVAADSAARLGQILSASGLPAAGPGRTRQSESLTLLGRLDRTPYERRALSLTGYLGMARDEAALPLATATAGHGRRSASEQGQLQGGYSFYFGREYLNETQSAVSFHRDRTTPYLALPEGRVRVASALDGGAGAVSSLAFGGGGAPTRRGSWRWETTDQLQLYTRASRHKVKLYGQSRLEGFSRAALDAPGSFTFLSLADVAANRPATFSRTLHSPSVSGGEWSGALAAADLWKATDFFRVMYGARVEGNRYLGVPAANPAVASTFGARTDRAPNTVHVSPRVGFTWSYVKATANTFSQMMGPLGQFRSGPRGVLRGGVGEFRDALRPDLLAHARTANGLPTGERTLFCAGSAVPAPDWAAYEADPSSIPTTCADGSTPAFSDAAPGVELFAKDYTAARSWRANLGWTSNFKHLAFTVDGVYALNLNQPSWVDLNFAGSPAFTLAAEGGRPVFVPAGDIVPSTGVVSPVAARRSGEFGRVVERRADLRSRARQVSFTASPRWGFAHSLSVTYTLAGTRALERGFDGSTFGDPRQAAWSQGALTPRHQVLVQGGLLVRSVSLTFAARAYSGLPYTPLVGGDVNGDGLANDRAFVFDPASADAGVAGGMRALLEQAPAGARECLRRQLGQAAERESCRGPWSVSTNARLGFSSGALHLPRRVNVSLNLSNPLAGIDRLVHGANGLRGWGQAATPDPTLLVVRGFDPAARAFRYDVNPRFGATSPSLGTWRDPFRLTLDASVDLGPALDIQQIRRMLRPGRAGRPGPRLGVDALRERYARNVPDPYASILDLSDSLLLTPQQVVAVRHAAAVYRQRADSAWTDLATYLSALPDRYDAAAALKRQEDTTDAVWDLTTDERAVIEGILSPLQQSMLPPHIVSILHRKHGDKMRWYMG